MVSDAVSCPLHNLKTVWNILMMPSILNTVRNIVIRLYGSVEEVVTMCLVYKIWRLQFQKKFSWIWILCQNSLTRELKIRFVGLEL